MTTEAQLRGATQRLRSHPLDHGAWLEVAVTLQARGEVAAAELAFATLGEAARTAGQVALAIACGRYLGELGSARGAALLDAVVALYAGSDASPEAPPAPAASASPPELAIRAGTAVAEARQVIEGLGAWLAAREIASVPPAPLLSALTPAAARALIDAMTARAVPAGHAIIELGAPATALYWLAHGTLTVARAQPTASATTAPPSEAGDATSPSELVHLGELHSGAFFGEIALVGGIRRTASVTARDDAWLLEIPARAIETAAQQHPALAEVLALHARTRLLANLVRTSDLFRALPDADRDALLGKFEPQWIAEGTAFLSEGQHNEFLWVVVSGMCEVRTAGAALSELGPGAAVGEISLVTGAPAVADVVATEPALLLRLAKRDFDAIAARSPALRAEVDKLVAARETANRALFQDASDLIV